jgi:hypothetical protein
MSYTEPLYRFWWKTGKWEESHGKNVAEAFSRLGYGAGAIAALDYYETLDGKHGVDEIYETKEKGTNQ